MNERGHSVSPPNDRKKVCIMKVLGSVKGFLGGQGFNGDIFEDNEVENHMNDDPAMDNQGSEDAPAPEL